MHGEERGGAARRWRRGARGPGLWEAETGELGELGETGDTDRTLWEVDVGTRVVPAQTDPGYQVMAL